MLLKYRYLGSFPSDYVPILPNETFSIVNTQTRNINGEHVIIIVFFKLFRSIQFLQEALKAHDTKFTTIQSKR